MSARITCCDRFGLSAGKGVTGGAAHSPLRRASRGDATCGATAVPQPGNGLARGERRPQARKAACEARGASIDGTIIAGASVVGAFAMVIIASSRLWPPSELWILLWSGEVCPGFLRSSSTCSQNAHAGLLLARGQDVHHPRACDSCLQRSLRVCRCLRSAKRLKPRLVGVACSSLRSSRPVSCQRHWSRAEKHRGAASPQQHNCLFRVGCLSPSICASLLELPSRSARRSAVLRPGGILLKKHVQHAQLQAAVHMPQPGVHASDRLAAHTAASPDLLLALALSDPPTVAFAKRCSSAGSGSVAGVLETEAYYFLSLATGRSPKSAAGVTGRDKADCILRTYSTEDAPHEERAGSGGPSKGLYRLTIIYPGAAVL